MKKLYFLLILLFGILFSCHENEEPKLLEEEEIFWVYSYPINSMLGAMPDFLGLRYQMRENLILKDKNLSFESVTSPVIACLGEFQIPTFPGLGANFKREENTLTFYSEEEGEVAVWEKLN